MQQLEILALAGLRLDGRRYDELRTIKAKLSVLPTADGSVYYEQVNKYIHNLVVMFYTYI